MDEPVGRPRRIYLCKGDDCKKHKRAWSKLRALLKGVEGVEKVRCQKICSGPVLGASVDGRVQWFERVRGGALRAAVGRLLGEGVLEDALEARRVQDRAGRRR